MSRTLTESGLCLMLPRRKLTTLGILIAGLFLIPLSLVVLRGRTAVIQMSNSEVLQNSVDIGLPEEQQTLQGNLLGQLKERLANWYNKQDLSPPFLAPATPGRPVEALGRRPRLLCWLMTDPGQQNKTTPAWNTWMSRCDVSLLMSSEGNVTYPMISLPGVKDGRDNIAHKSRTSWKYIYDHHINEADFFIKGDPDSYVMTDNLRYFLSQCNSSLPQIYGHALFLRPQPGSAIHYAAGQAVVLTREALRRLVTKALVQYPDCFPDGQSEDMKTAQCLTLVGGHMVDTRDNFGRETFLPPVKAANMRPERFKFEYESAWYYSYRDPYGICDDMTERCISERPVAFHRITDDLMYMMNFFERLLRKVTPPDVYSDDGATSAPGEQSDNQFYTAPSGEYRIPPRLSFNGTEYIGKAILMKKETNQTLSVR